MFNVEIISPQGPIYSGQCHMVVVPSTVGDIGFMQNHEAVISDLREGKVAVYEKGASVPVKEIDVKSGTAEMHDGQRLLVLIDS